MPKIIKNGIEYGASPSNIGDLQDTNISSPATRNVLAYDSTSSKWINSIPNEFVANVPSGSSIRAILTDTSISKGVYFYETRYASDNPVGDSAITTTLIYKNSSNGNYSKIYAATGNNIYFASTGSSVPSELSWKLIISERTEITSQVTFNETTSGTNTRFYVKNNVLYIFYQGESKAHSANDLLFTLPSGYRPAALVYVTFLSSNGINFIVGDVSINVDGKCYVNQIADTSGAGRIYFSVAIPL